MLQWNDPASFIQGATPSVRKAWTTLGIGTVGDLLLTLPRRYDDYSRIVRIADAQTDSVVTLRGTVEKAVQLPTFRKRMPIIRVTIHDGSGRISANFFNQLWLLKELTPGRLIYLSGKVVKHPRYGRSLANPLWEPGDAATLAAGKIAPVYALTGSLAQKTYRRMVAYALENTVYPEDALDGEDRKRLDLPSWERAIRMVHAPENMEEAERGRERLAFDELAAYQLALGLSSREAKSAGAPPIPFDERFAKAFVASLRFPLTGDQKRAAWACLQDIQRDVPMRRLLQGDVGSGKTVVAAFVAACVQRSGFSAVVLAPTDILAKQHAETLRRLLTPHHIPCLLITRTDKRLLTLGDMETLTAAEAEKLASRGNIVVVGTHAVLEQRRLPPDTAFAVVDEQHRFGVEQRETLAVGARADGKVPHLLSMTATPIPRSLALTLYSDLEVSIIHEKPVGRLPITTHVVTGEAREEAYESIRVAAKRGERSFLVCPLIDPSDALGAKSVTEEATKLSAGPLAGLRVGILHGKKKAEEKEEVMAAFAAGDVDVLIATSVIEVGVDVPEATVMAIEGAERFGLAQLHQLRGRVGRSNRPSTCWLMTDAEGPSLERVKLLERLQDGFRLAEEDLKRRGSGNLLGTMQSGLGDFRAARLTDVRLMAVTREFAQSLLRDTQYAIRNTWLARAEQLRATAHLE